MFKSLLLMLKVIGIVMIVQLDAFVLEKTVKVMTRCSNRRRCGARMSTEINIASTVTLKLLSQPCM